MLPAHSVKHVTLKNLLNVNYQQSHFSFQKVVIVVGGSNDETIAETEVLDVASLEWQLGPKLPTG